MIDMDFLSKINLFSTLAAPDLENLVKHISIIQKNENDIIFKKGEPGRSMYIIQEGTVKITIHAQNGEELILAILHKGDFFGELTMFDKSSRTANAIVYDHATLLEISSKNYIEFMKFHPDTAIAMISVLGKRLRETNQIMERQATRNVNDEMEKELSFGDHVADIFAEFIGSWTFIILFTVGLIAWILLNLYVVFFSNVDPYPFILLNLILSCLAAIQAPVIMMSQGRQAKKDKIAADFDYKINLKAELQIQEIRVQIDKINKQENKLYKEIRHEQSEIIKHQQQILEKLDNINNQKI